MTAHTVLAAFLPDLDDGIALPSITNGTGFPDYLLTGLTTANLDPTHQDAFFARLTGANDGPDRFFIVPALVPGPVVGALLPSMLAGLGLAWLQLAAAPASRVMRKRPLLTKAEKKKRQRAAQARWRKRNPDYQHEWQVANRRYVTQQKRKYRARKAGATDD